MSHSIIFKTSDEYETILSEQVYTTHQCPKTKSTKQSLAGSDGISILVKTMTDDDLLREYSCSPNTSDQILTLC